MREHDHLMVRGQIGDALGYFFHTPVIKTGHRVIEDHWDRIIAHFDFSNEIGDSDNFLFSPQTRP